MPHPAMEDIFQKIAAAHGTSANEVKAQIQAAIVQGLSNPDPSVQKAWRSIPRQGETPLPEELLLYLLGTSTDPTLRAP